MKRLQEHSMYRVVSHVAFVRKSCQSAVTNS